MSWVTLDGSGNVAGYAAWAPSPSTGWLQVLDSDPRIAVFLAPRAPTTLDALAFIARFSAAEQQKIITASQAPSGWQVALWLHMLAASGTADVTAPALTSGMAALVAAGLLTSARSTQILDLAAASP